MSFKGKEPPAKYLASAVYKFNASVGCIAFPTFIILWLFIERELLGARISFNLVVFK
jgi:hypothetical protein